MGEKQECVILMDNGSLRPEATLSLRGLAEELGARIDRKVFPVSLLHSSKVDAEKLGGQKADVMVPFLKRQYAAGVRRFLVVPLFFGPSAAFKEYLPGRLEELRNEGLADLVVQFAEPMVAMDEVDREVAKVMADQVRAAISEQGLDKPAVAMVDHGTPLRAVNEVRERVAVLMAEELGDEVSSVRACSMERREGEEYDFNEPLLERLLGSEGYTADVVVSLLFAAPGRHAGDGGDVNQICQAALSGCPGLRVFRTGLYSEDAKKVSAILAERYLKLTKGVV
ncbi:hypothetical protein Rhal01_03598 [Rubritalea halochordaticola]|uniref:Cobalamin biosynthesis protein CbiX n=1 Tax=Rubritalea halochordaticola TaxID=714537 RepID=A0ABP9V407_9BACT